MKTGSGRERREVSPHDSLVYELGKALLKIDAFKVGTFSLPDGKVTPYFIDLRKLPSFPEAFELASSCLESSLVKLEKEKEMRFETLCGVPISGLVLLASLATRLKRPLIYPARDSQQPRIQGYLRPGSQVLVVDDVSNTGKSLRAAAQAAISNGGVVKMAMSLIDRGEEAGKNLQEIGIELRYFTTTREIASILKEMMALTEEQEKAIEQGESKPI